MRRHRLRFAGAGMAATAHLRTWSDFAWIDALQVPLFRFSATFVPLETYRPALRSVVRSAPLFHGVELCRSLTHRADRLGFPGHAAYRLLMGAAGLAVAVGRLGRLLKP